MARELAVRLSVRDFISWVRAYGRISGMTAYNLYSAPIYCLARALRLLAGQWTAQFRMGNSVGSEGLKAARLLMVLSSISPLFVLWALRGNKLLAGRYFLPICGAIVVLPNLFLWMRIRTAKKLKEKRELVVSVAEDHRGDILVYLFAMLLPLYPIDLGTFRDLAALLAALAFVVFLFWHLSLHYMNLLFALFGYRARR